MKRKILMVNEAHYVSSGYGTYGANVLSRLAKHPDLEVAELAAYGLIGRERDCTWKYYANAVSEGHPDYNEYRKHSQNEYGRWRFDRVLLDFKPDFVFDIRDPWHITFECVSGLRPYYHLCLMPTVDSAPQKTEWLDTFLNADSIFTYSKYGQEVLSNSIDGINLAGIASPGVDLATFKPVANKASHKQSFGLDRDALVVGTIMRNQSRKLYPDLMQAFKLYLDKCYKGGRKDLADRSYLYLHTSYPDMSGWELAEILLEHELTNKVLFTYICKSCDSVFTSFFNDSRTTCRQCGTKNATMTSTSNGIESEQLATIINLFDIYVQYATCEGYGMPQVEAAACGVPLIAVDYSAMRDIVNTVRGVALKPERMFRDIHTHAYRALPNNSQCADNIYLYLTLPDSIRMKKGVNTRRIAEENFGWDKTADLLSNYFLSAPLTGLQGKWDSTPRVFVDPPSFNEYKNLSNSEYVDWLIKKVLQDPSKRHTRYALEATRRLENVVEQQGRKYIKTTREGLYKNFSEALSNKRILEAARCGQLNIENPDYIEYANTKELYR